MVPHLTMVPCGPGTSMTRIQIRLVQENGRLRRQVHIDTIAFVYGYCNTLMVGSKWQVFFIVQLTGGET